MSAGQAIRSPKQPQAERGRSWYPYYAGYRPEFVEDVVNQYCRTAEHIIDPWNGSGTTTFAASRMGRMSTGLDVNPALTVIARARLVPCSVSDSLQPLAVRLLEVADPQSVHLEQEDLLLTWYRAPAARIVRSIQIAIDTTLVESRGLAQDGWEHRHVPLLAAFYYTALFATVREGLVRFRSSNPTWLLKPRTVSHRLAPSWQTLSLGFRGHVARLAGLLALHNDSEASLATVATGSAERLDLGQQLADAAVTSPPYCTRVDYVRGSLAELAVLGLSTEQVDRLRSATMGTPVVSGIDVTTMPTGSAMAQRYVRNVAEHHTKGSRSYYAPWFSRYFRDLDASLRELSRVVHGPICIVVQDSYYKEMHIDLQMVVTEFMMSTGRDLKARHEFRATHLKSTMNPAARKHLAERQGVESLLVFE